MSYVSKTTTHDENFLIHAHISKVFWLANLVYAVVTISIMYGVMFYLFHTFLRTQIEAYPYAHLIQYGIIGLAFLYLIYRIARSFIFYTTTEIAVSNKRFIVKFGWISRRVTEISIPKIEGVFLNQGIIGRLFRYGSVTVRGTGGDFAVAPCAHNPLALQAALHEAIRLTRP